MLTQPRFSLRSFFPVFVFVGLAVTAFKQSDETWGAISLIATVLALVWLVVEAIYNDNTVAFGCVAGFIAYISLASTVFGAFNPIVDYLQRSRGINGVGIHLWHLYAGWAVGLVAAPVAWLVRNNITNSRRLGILWLTQCLLCGLGLITLQIYGWPFTTNGCFALLMLVVSAMTAATTAVHCKDVFGTGYLVGLISYVSLGNYYFSVLNPVDQTLVGNRSGLVVTLPITAAWGTSILCGSLAFLICRIRHLEADSTTEDRADG